MLQEIREITNVGTFYGFRPEKPVELRKLTLIYGPNGTGKTTLCAILRSLARNDPDILVGRKTLNSQGDSRVELGLAGGEWCEWDGEAWSGDRPKIEIFDEQFVRDNLYTDTVEVEHKRNLLNVILGEEEVAINKEIFDKTEYGKTIQNKIRDTETALEKVIGGTMTVEDFLALTEDPDIKKKIEEQQKLVEAHENAERVRKQEGLELLPLPEPLEGLEALLGRRFEELAEDAEQLLQHHLKQFGCKRDHREWLERGLTYVEGEVCPFCGQSLGGVDLLRAYRTVFDARYRKHKEEIERALQELDDKFGVQASARLGEIIAKNAARARFWERYVVAEWSILGDGLDWKEVWERYYRAARAALEKKRSSPLEPVSAEDLRQPGEWLHGMLKVLHEQNDSIAVINSKIEDVKRSVSSEEVERAKEELARLELVRQRFERQTIECCNEYKDLKDRKRRIEEEKEVLKSRIDNLSEKALGASMKRVNDLLEQFNAGFRLYNMKRKQTKGWGEALWTIAIRETPIDVAKKATPSEPNFKNTLSAGDRSALAFAFFLAQLEQKQDLGERIVVLDDPFTSQDSFRRRRTIKAIMGVSRSVEQCIILSHDVQFLREIEKIAAGRGYLATLDLCEAEVVGAQLRSCALVFVAGVTTTADYQDLELYLKKGEGKPVDVIRKIRPVLEYTFRKLFPDKIRPADTLDSIVGKLNSLGSTVAIYADTIRDIYQYVTPYHHAERPEDDSRPPLDPEELRRFVADTIKIVEALRNDHAKV